MDFHSGSIGGLSSGGNGYIDAAALVRGIRSSSFERFLERFCCPVIAFCDVTVRVRLGLVRACFLQSTPEGEFKSRSHFHHVLVLRLPKSPKHGENVRERSSAVASEPHDLRREITLPLASQPPNTRVVKRSTEPPFFFSSVMFPPPETKRPSLFFC